MARTALKNAASHSADAYDAWEPFKVPPYANYFRQDQHRRFRKQPANNTSFRRSIVKTIHHRHHNHSLTSGISDRARSDANIYNMMGSVGSLGSMAITQGSFLTVI